MGNTEIIDEIVDPVTSKQIADLKADLITLDKQFVDTAKSAVALNNAIGSSKSFADYEKKADAAKIANEKLQQAQNNTAKSAIQLQKAQQQLEAQTLRQQKAAEKAAEAAKKALSPYQQLSKQLDELRAHAKDIGVQFGTNSKQFEEAAKPVKELDARLKGIDQTLGQSQRNVGNYGRAFSEAFSEYLPFLGGTIRIRENLKETGEALGVTEEKLGALGSAFAGFGIGAFAVAMGLAINYMTQFQGYADKLDIFFANIKGRVNFLGSKIASLLPNEDGEDEKKSLTFWQKFGKIAKEQALDVITLGFKSVTDEAGHAAETVEKLNIKLRDEQKIVDVLNGRDQAASDNLRTLAENKKLDISIRQQYYEQAEGLDEKILERSKEDSKKQLDVAIKQANVLGVLKKGQIDELRKGNIALATELSVSTDPKKQITKEAYENLVKAYEAQNRVEEIQTQNLQKIRNDRAALELRSENELAKAQERLDRARIQGQLDAAKVVLDSDTTSYDQKISAQKRFVDNSLRLLQIEKKNKLEAAGIGSVRGGKDSAVEAKNRLAIEQEYQNEKNKVTDEGIKQELKIRKDAEIQIRKLFKDGLKDQELAEQKTIDTDKDQQNSRLLNIEQFKAESLKALTDQYAQGKISTAKYNADLQEIEYDAARDRVQTEIDTQKQVIATQEEYLKFGIGSDKELQASKDQLTKFEIEASNLETQNELKNIQQVKQAKQEMHALEKEIAGSSIELIKQLVDNGYQNQLDALKRQSEQITINYDAEKKAVDGSIQSNADKARKKNLIDAREAQEQQKIAQEEIKIKQKQAAFQKAADIAKTVSATAFAEVDALQYLSNPLTAPLYPAIAALIAGLGAAQLATIVATPLPKFAIGTESSPEGFAHVGERGREIMITPDGMASLTPNHDTVTWLPKGTQIIPNHMIKPDVQKYVGGQQVPWREVIAAIERSKPQPQKRQPIVFKGVDKEMFRRMRR